jgi:hypothetical protein
VVLETVIVCAYPVTTSPDKAVVGCEDTVKVLPLFPVTVVPAGKTPGPDATTCIPTTSKEASSTVMEVPVE